MTIAQYTIPGVRRSPYWTSVTGASPGKALLGIRVVRDDGTMPGKLRSFVRLVAWVVDGLALLVPVALWSAWLTPGHRRVGDWVAGEGVLGLRRAFEMAAAQFRLSQDRSVV